MASWKLRAKMLLRSRSARFVRDAFGPFDARPASIDWGGMRLHYRPGSSDARILYDHLMKPAHREEYAPPPSMPLAPGEVRTVLDIGGNIGATALNFARVFPNATVFAFEPAPDNFAVLARNAANCDRIRPFNVGLGPRDATLELFASDDPANFGGYSLHAAGSDPSRRTSVPVRAVAGILAELGVAAPDVIKVDTEGAEWDILTAFPEPVLASAAYVTGELHGNRDFALLEYLSRWFDVGARKQLGRRLFNFQAVRRRAAP